MSENSPITGLPVARNSYVQQHKKAKYVNHCSNGHPLERGQVIGIAKDKTVVCIKCFGEHLFNPQPKELRSNKFCSNCFLELPLAGTCGNCE